MTTLALLLLLAAEPATPVAATNALAAPAYATAGYTRPAEVEKGCVAGAIRIPQGLAGLGASVTIKFAVGPDGAVSQFEDLTSAPEPLAAAIWEAVQRCKFAPGKNPQGEPASIWMILPLRFHPDPGPAASRPSNLLEEAEPGCFERYLHYRLPPNRLLQGRLDFQVELTAEGKVSAVELPPGLPTDAREAIELSVQSCRYRPALDAGGRPVAGRFSYSLTFTQPGEAERAAAATQLKREARLASTTCLQRINPPGGIGHIVVQVRVTAQGEPTNFRLKPDNVPADWRLQMFDVLASCVWEPAIGLDGRPVAGETAVTIRFR